MPTCQQCAASMQPNHHHPTPTRPLTPTSIDPPWAFGVVACKSCSFLTRQDSVHNRCPLGIDVPGVCRTCSTAACVAVPPGCMACGRPPWTQRSHPERSQRGATPNRTASSKRVATFLSLQSAGACRHPWPHAMVISSCAVLADVPPDRIAPL